MRVPEVIERFFAARRPRKESVHTTAAYRRDLETISSRVAEARGVDVSDLELTDLDRDALRGAFGAYADDHAAATVLRTWSAWNQLFTFAVAEGIETGNPMAAVARPRRPPRRPKPLQGEDTPEQLLERMAGGAEPGTRRRYWPERDLAILALALVTGLRSAEILSLDLSSLVGRPGERRIHVVGKGGKSRSVPVEDSLEDVLDGYLRSRRTRFPTERPGREGALFVDFAGEPLRRGGLQYLVRSAYRGAGLNDRVPVGANVHALRHTFATRLAEDGATASEIMTLLGHASIATSQGYIDATTREQRAAAAANRTYRVLDRLR
jgi:site-specific recombinase XerD